MFVQHVQHLPTVVRVFSMGVVMSAQLSFCPIALLPYLGVGEHITHVPYAHQACMLKLHLYSVVNIHMTTF